MLKLFMNKNGNATALLIFVVVSLVLIFIVPAPERFEDEPQEEPEDDGEIEEEPTDDGEIEEEPTDDGEIEEDQVVDEEESVAPEAETNMAPANPVISEQPASIQGTPAAAPVIDTPSSAVIQPNQRRIVGAVPVQENLPMVGFSTNQPSPVIAQTEDGKRVVLMIPASIKNA